MQLQLANLALLHFGGIIAPMSDTNKLNHYLAAWELSNPHLLTQTMTSHIYTVTHGSRDRRPQTAGPIGDGGAAGRAGAALF